MNEKTFFVTKQNGEREAFDIQKLQFSLQRAKASPEAIKQVCDRITAELEDGTSTHAIYQHAFQLLHSFEKKAAVRYSLRRALMELGPSGFPFEQFVAEIFRSKGYETVTDQIVLGGCVEHEIDVVAWKKDELIMSEVKFHGDIGLKSDLKVVLYVHARFEDLAENVYEYGGKTHKLTGGWLITNTKFTVSAIKYAVCKKMNIVGWNYPVEGNLHDMIEDANLHPITSLHTLSDHDKKELLNRKVVLCSSLAKKPSLLADLGLSDANIETVLDEIKQLGFSDKE